MLSQVEDVEGCQVEMRGWNRRIPGGEIGLLKVTTATSKLSDKTRAKII